MSISREQIEAGQLTLSQAAFAEIEKSIAEGPRPPRNAEKCPVCCEVESRDLVNKLLAVGMTNREIVDTCSAINERRFAKGDDRAINAKAVWWHRRDHFNVQNPAKAIYREIVERRAEEANRDHINGIGHALSVLAALETTMVKGYSRMVEDNTVVTVKEMILAATQLHMMTSDTKQARMSDLLYRLDRIISAAQQFIPPEHHAAFAAVVEGRGLPGAPTQVLPPQKNQPFREFSAADDDDDDAEF